MTDIQKIYPEPDELKTINSHVPCTEYGCSATFSSESNLNLHLVKTHKKEWKVDNCTKHKEYYCPDTTCIYNKTKCFKTFKLLKQHYLKVHSDKTFICDKCNKGFPTASLKNSHSEYCGINFQCCDCETSYPLYESLLTHGRRKKHNILKKNMYNPNLKLKSKSSPDVRMLKKNLYVLPNDSTNAFLIIPLLVKSDTNINLDKSSQTDTRRDVPQFKTKQTQASIAGLHSLWNSKYSQTSGLSKMWSSAETQTMGDYFKKKQKLFIDDISMDLVKPSNILQKTTTTQTNQDLRTISCNTSFIMDESEYDPFIQRSSSSTQTAAFCDNEIPTDMLYSASTSTHDSIHTDTSDLNFLFMESNSQTDFDDVSNFYSPSFLNCNIETQTDLMFNTELLNDDCYSNSNIETQTTNFENFESDCVEFTNYFKSPVYNLSNTIHTQTMFDYLSCSVESQTLMSHNKLHGLTYIDSANTETQTKI